MTDPYTRFSTATGDFGTPGIAPNQQQSGTILNPYAPWWQQVLQWYAGTSAKLGAKAGGATPSEQAAAGYEASKAPLAAPIAAAKGQLPGTGWIADLEKWTQAQGRIVGIYGIFLVIGIIGLVFLLSSAGVSVGPVRIGK